MTNSLTSKSANVDGVEWSSKTKQRTKIHRVWKAIISQSFLITVYEGVDK